MFFQLNYIGDSTERLLDRMDFDDNNKLYSKYSKVIR